MKTEDDVPASNRAPEVVGLGELIWDILPGGKQLGGAPTNFAYISRLLGNQTIVASRVGADELGREAIAWLRRLGIQTDYLQLDPEHPTGTVLVEIGLGGEPRFAVNQNSAWDYLEWSAAWAKLARQTDAVCFGTLGQREPRARQTIIRFLRQTRPLALRIFDVNLRHSFFTAKMLRDSLKLATVVKLNSDELSTVASMLEFEETEEESIGKRLLALFDARLIAITRGENGSLLLTDKETINHPGLRVQVKDTIGAGDAFTATLAHFYLRGAALKIISEAANRMGAWVATQTGATPEITSQLLKEILGDATFTTP
jgi:fructokinase